MEKRTCAIDGCDHEKRSRGLCNRHYKAARRRGELTRDCETCGSIISGRPNSKYCSRECSGETCFVADCDGEPKALGYCNKHHKRLRAHGLTDAPRLEYRARDGMKKCSRCLQVKPCGDFRGHVRSYDGFQARCRECANADTREWRAKNKARTSIEIPETKTCYSCKRHLDADRFYRQATNTDGLKSDCRDCCAERKRRLLANDPNYNRRQLAWQKYRLTLDEYDALMNAGCRICGRAAEAVDHDHACCPGSRTCGACVRGGLCSNCNIGVGMFYDDPTLLTNAIDYLTAWEASRGQVEVSSHTA